MGNIRQLQGLHGAPHYRCRSSAEEVMMASSQNRSVSIDRINIVIHTKGVAWSGNFDSAGAFMQSGGRDVFS